VGGSDSAVWFLLDGSMPSPPNVGPRERRRPPDEVCDRRGMGPEDRRLLPTLRILKHSFNADTDHLIGTQNLVFDGLNLYSKTDEGQEGFTAYREKRPPDFGGFR
jgi:naphthoate synthase